MTRLLAYYSHYHKVPMLPQMRDISCLAINPHLTLVQKWPNVSVLGSAVKVTGRYLTIGSFCQLKVKELGIKNSSAVEGYGNSVKIFKSRPLPERGWLVGYAALIDQYNLELPLPPRLAIATERERPPSSTDWLLIRQSRRPENTLSGHLDFALRREGVDLAVLNSLFKKIPKTDIESIVRQSPTGVHTRRLWFLYEWLRNDLLDVPNAPKVKAVPIVEEKHQVALQNYQ